MAKQKAQSIKSDSIESDLRTLEGGNRIPMKKVKAALKNYPKDYQHNPELKPHIEKVIINQKEFDERSIGE